MMHEPLVPMLFPVFGAHISDSGFQYPDNIWKEPTGIMANLVAKSGGNKGQLSLLGEAIYRPTTSDLAGCLLRLSGLSAPTWLGDGDEGCAK